MKKSLFVLAALVVCSGSALADVRPVSGSLFDATFDIQLDDQSSAALYRKLVADSRTTVENSPYGVLTKLGPTTCVSYANQPPICSISLAPQRCFW